MSINRKFVNQYVDNHMSMKQLDQEQARLMKQRNLIINQQQQNKQIYQRLDLIDLFGDRKNEKQELQKKQTKEEKMYFLTEKFQKYIKSLATQKLCNKMGNIIWQSNRLIGQSEKSRSKSKQALKKYESSLTKKSNYLSSSKSSHKSRSTIQNAIQGQLPRPIDRYKQTDLESHYQYSNQIIPNKYTPLNQLQINQVKKIDNLKEKQYIDMSQSITNVERQLFQQEKIILFNQLNTYIKKSFYQQKINTILHHHIQNLHRYIVQFKSHYQNNDQSHQSFNQFFDMTCFTPNSKDISRLTQSNSSSKSYLDNQIQILKLQINLLLSQNTTYKNQLQFLKIHQNNNNLNQSNNKRPDRFKLYLQQIEQIRQQIHAINMLVKQQLSNNYVNKPYTIDKKCFDCPRFERTIIELQDEILFQEEKRMNFFQQVKVFKHQMHQLKFQNEQLTRQNNKLKSTNPIESQRTNRFINRQSQTERFYKENDKNKLLNLTNSTNRRSKSKTFNTDNSKINRERQGQDYNMFEQSCYMQNSGCTDSSLYTRITLKTQF